MIRSKNMEARLIWGFWLRCVPYDRCPICGAESGCLIQTDRKFVICLNEESDKPHEETAGWLHCTFPNKAERRRTGLTKWQRKWID